MASASAMARPASTKAESILPRMASKNGFSVVDVDKVLPVETYKIITLCARYGTRKKISAELHFFSLTLSGLTIVKYMKFVFQNVMLFQLVLCKTI